MDARRGVLEMEEIATITAPLTHTETVAAHQVRPLCLIVDTHLAIICTHVLQIADETATVDARDRRPT